MSLWLDDIAKGLATEHISRRQAMGRIAAGLAGVLAPEALTGGASATILPCFLKGEHRCRSKCCAAHEHCCKGAHRTSCCKSGEHCHQGRCVRHGKCPRHRKVCGAPFSAPGHTPIQACCSPHQKCCISEKTGVGRCIKSSEVCCPNIQYGQYPYFCPPHTTCSGGPVNGNGNCCTSNQVVCGGDCCDPGYMCCLGSNGDGGCVDPSDGPCCKCPNGEPIQCIGGPDCYCLDNAC